MSRGPARRPDSGITASLAGGLLVLTIAAGCSEAESVRWQSRDDGSPPTLSDSSDCRAQARRQAEMRFPATQGLGRRVEVVLPGEADRFAAENRLYVECMRQKGFDLVKA
jgi:hypothetical protein